MRGRRGFLKGKRRERKRRCHVSSKTLTVMEYLKGKEKEKRDKRKKEKEIQEKLFIVW